MWFCLDVDADRTPEQLLAKKYPEHDRMSDFMKANELRKIAHHLATQPSKPPLEDRCTLVNRALRRLGINPENPRSVLNLASPSGGRHVYIFFDALYSLDQYYDLLHVAGLRHVTGEIEFYPATNQGFRLPFGYLPGQPHDPPMTPLPGSSSWMISRMVRSFVIPLLICTTTWPSTTQPSTGELNH
jgi:hypothetical protein